MFDIETNGSAKEDASVVKVYVYIFYCRPRFVIFKIYPLFASVRIQLSWPAPSIVFMRPWRLPLIH